MDEDKLIELMREITDYLNESGNQEETIEGFYSETKPGRFISEPFLCKKAYEVSIYVYEERDKVEKISKLNLI